MKTSALKDYQKSELINGIVYDMSPANIKHIFVQRNLSNIIWNFLKGKCCEVVTEAEVRFDKENRFIPDISIACNPAQIKNNYIEGAPDFVAEVLSPSTSKRDLTVKKDTYEKYGVKEYWTIDPKAESITVYILKDGKYELNEIYHNISDSEMEEMDEKEREQLRLTLKISLYDDLEIAIKDIF